jgi:hypothetical protein
MRPSDFPDGSTKNQAFRCNISPTLWFDVAISPILRRTVDSKHPKQICRCV